MAIASANINDWTSGTGTISAGGTITINPEPQRNGIYVQNLDTTVVNVVLPAINAATGASSTGTVALAADTSTGAGAGGKLNSFVDGVISNGQILVVGTAGKKVTVLTF